MKALNEIAPDALVTAIQDIDLDNAWLDEDKQLILEGWENESDDSYFEVSLNVPTALISEDDCGDPFLFNNDEQSAIVLLQHNGINTPELEARLDELVKEKQHATEEKKAKVARKKEILNSEDFKPIKDKILAKIGKTFVQEELSLSDKERRTDRHEYVFTESMADAEIEKEVNKLLG